MAIEKPIQEITFKLKEEIASKETKMFRIIQLDKDTNTILSSYPISIWAESITYEVDDDGNKVDIYDREDMGVVTLSTEDVQGLWAEEVTLSDGTKAYLGNVIADKIDSILRVKLGI